jgi:hypothetical protein
MTVDDHGATTGNGYVTHTCQSEYKGREQRTGYTTISTIETTPKTATVEFIQLGHEEYIQFDAPSYNAMAAAGNVIITGKTNAPRLDFALTVNQGSMGEVQEYFSIDGGTTYDQDSSGQVFVGDPGATGEISFTIIVEVAANSSTSSRYCTLTATGSQGVTKSCNIIQAAGESYLWVDEENTTSKTITFSASGLSGSSSSVDVDVLCNETWEVDVHE